LLKGVYMTFGEYSEEVKKTIVYPNPGNNYIYPVIGLGGEVGELQNKVKKILRGDCELTFEKRIEIALEIGDILWYCSALASELNMSLEWIADENIKKLAKRMEENKIKGDGDKR